jgi:MOSC domain-containing protein YiiM
VKTVVDFVYTGRLRSLPPEGQQTGIFKNAVAGRVAVGLEGLAGDAQADRRVHGGPEKAVHYYPAEHYAGLAEEVPERAGLLHPGALGENLSARGLTEQNVCIGDVFALGSSRLQVSQPRQPCWKISHKLDHPPMSRLIAAKGWTGWYFRVLQEGEIAAGDVLELIERPAPECTLARLWAVCQLHRADPRELQLLAAAEGLNDAWSRRLRDRAAWLLSQDVPPC